MATMESMDPKTRAYISMYRWHRIESTPWATLTRPLADCRVGLVVTACMVMRDQRPFDAEQPDADPSMRVVPADTDPATLVNTFPSQAFDHAGLSADANLLVPIERMHELARNGEIGELAPRVVSLCGHLPKPQRLISDTAPDIAQMFVDDRVDVALLVPA